MWRSLAFRTWEVFWLWALCVCALADNPSQISSVSVAVKVLDVNDNPPSLTHYLETYVCENAKAGQVKTTAYASITSTTLDARKNTCTKNPPLHNESFSFVVLNPSIKLRWSESSRHDTILYVCCLSAGRDGDGSGSRWAPSWTTLPLQLSPRSRQQPQLHPERQPR